MYASFIFSVAQLCSFLFVFLDVHQRCLRQEFPLNKEANTPYLLQRRVGSMWIHPSTCVTSDCGREYLTAREMICHAIWIWALLKWCCLLWLEWFQQLEIGCTALIGLRLCKQILILTRNTTAYPYNIEMEHIQFKSLPIAHQFQVWARAPIIKNLERLRFWVTENHALAECAVQKKKIIKKMRQSIIFAPSVDNQSRFLNFLKGLHWFFCELCFPETAVPNAVLRRA